MTARPTDSVVVDASVALKWFVRLPGWEQAAAPLDQGVALYAPELVVAEVGNAAWKLALAGRISVSQGTRVATAVASAFARLVPSARLVEGAYAIATELGHPIYDCLYLRLAELESTRVLTADKRLIESVRGTRWEGLPKPLEHSSGP